MKKSSPRPGKGTLLSQGLSCSHQVESTDRNRESQISQFISEKKKKQHKTNKKPTNPLQLYTPRGMVDSCFLFKFWNHMIAKC